MRDYIIPSLEHDSKASGYDDPKEYIKVWVEWALGGESLGVLSGELLEPKFRPFYYREWIDAEDGGEPTMIVSTIFS